MKKLEGGKFSRIGWVRLIAAASMALAWVVSKWLYSALTENSDEGAYLSQADSLTHWQLTPTAFRPIEAFQTWFGFIRNGRVVYKYPPVYPAALALAKVITGTERSLGIVLAGAFVLLVSKLARNLNFGNRTQVVAAAIVALSPLMLIQNATFLPYVFSSVLLLTFVVLLTAPQRNSKTILLAGVVGSLAFWARPFDAVLFCVPVTIWTMSAIRSRSKVAKRMAQLGIGAAPGIAGFLLYNRAVTGSAFRLPFHLLDEADSIGFGLRRIQRSDPFLNFTVARAWYALIHNVGLLVSWSFGGFVLIALGFIFRTRAKATGSSRRGLLFLLLAVWPIGFFFFWGSFSYLYQWDGASFLGPYYYLPMLAPLAILGGYGLDQLLLRSKRGGAAAMVLSVAVSLPIAVHAVYTNTRRAQNRVAVADAVNQSVPKKNSLLLVPPVWGPHLQHPFSFLRNDSVTSDKRLSVLSGDLRLVGEAVKLHPGRDLYRLTLPAGHESGGKGATVAAIDRVSLLTGVRIRVCLGALDRVPLRGLLLTVAIADQKTVVPLSSSGAASIGFFTTLETATVGVNGVGKQLLSFPVGLNSPDMKLELTIRGRNLGTAWERTATFSVPVNSGPSTSTLLWPPEVQQRDPEFDELGFSTEC